MIDHDNPVYPKLWVMDGMRPSTMKPTFWVNEENQPGMMISAFCEEDSEKAIKVIALLKERQLPSIEENYNAIIRELGYD